MKKILWIFVAVVFCLPFCFVLFLTIASGWRYPDLLPASWTSWNWMTLLQGNSGLLQSMGRSLAVSGTVAAAATGSGFWVGRIIARHRRRPLLLTLSYFPYAFSPVIYAFCLYYLFVQINAIGTLYGVMLAQFIIVFPFSVIMFVNHWSKSLFEYDQLVATLGGTPQQSFRFVLLPLSKTILAIGFFQNFLIAWFEYGLTAVIGLGKVHTLPLKTYQYIGEANSSVAAVASALVLFPPLILGWFNRNYLLNPSKM